MQPTSWTQQLRLSHVSLAHPHLSCVPSQMSGRRGPVLSLPRKAHVTTSTPVRLPDAFPVAPSADTAPAALSCSPRRRHRREIPISPCGTVCSGPASKPGLFLPVILILSSGVIGIELSVWKLLLGTQRIEESLEAELWEDSCRRPFGRGGSGFLE